MAGNSLNLNASLMCPHGGKVQIVSANARVSGGGAYLALANDTFTVTGCPFQLPGPTPSPCVLVRWTVTDQRVKVSGAPTLSLSSSGLCYSAAQAPQGPAVIVSTQAKVSSQ